VFPTVLNSSKQSGEIGHKRWSCGDVTTSSKVVWWSSGSREHSRRKAGNVWDGRCSRLPNDVPNDILTPFRRQYTDDPSTTFHVIARAFQSSLRFHNDHLRPLHASTTTVGHQKKREEGGNGH